MKGDWLALAKRAERRLIRTLDIFSILICDLVVITVGYTVTSVAKYLSRPGSPFFSAAERISEGMFLIIYAIMVSRDCWEFLTGEAREGSTSSVVSRSI